MYPDFHYLLKSLLNIDIPVLSLIKTFGFFVALAFIAAYRITYAELKRKAAAGLFTAKEETHTVGLPVQSKDLISSALLGFIMGFKVVGLLLNYKEATADPLSFVMSLRGNWIAGILLAAGMAYLTYREKKKEELPTPKKVIQKVYPHDRMMNIVLIAAGFGFLGAKVFNALETWDNFVADPLGSLFSSGGFTFYGGLICATVALFVYARKHQFSFKHLADATAPALMIAYAIGRLGCHFAGDGDWGIYNSAYITQPDASLVEQVDDKAFHKLVEEQPSYFHEFKNFKEVPNKFVKAPDYLPRWFFAMNYAHNVNNEGLVIAGDDGAYNRALPAAVFPTPVYEFVVCSLLFGILMFFRRKWTVPLKMLGAYLIFNGLERFFIEKIRVNYKYDWLLNLTQAEIISFIFIVLGLVLFFRKEKKKDVLS